MKWIIRSICLGIIFWLIFGYKLEFPDHYLIDDFPLVEQPNQITCGPTSVYMTLLYYRKDVTLNEVITNTKTQWFSYKKNPIGMTEPFGIIQSLRNYGLNPAIQSGDIAWIKYYIGKNKPVIVLVRSGKKVWHYMVAIGYTENEIIFANPATGKEKTLTLDHFLGSWSFRTDLSGKFLGHQCFFCKGRGIFFIAGKPLMLCDVCGGKGEVDHLVSFMKTCEVYPYTMIVPNR